MRKYFIAANWKMNLTQRDAIKLAKEIDTITKPLDSNVEVIMCVPFIHIQLISEYLSNSAISVGAQNCNENQSGAFTGEISAEMIKSYNSEYVILGHSERRQYYNEFNDLINQKIKIALENKLKVILCIGEHLEERKIEKTKFILNTQLQECLIGIDKELYTNLIIAYEPIWAIGTGLTPTINEINETHNVIRNYLIEIIGSKGISVPILYGGSLNENNAGDILKIKEVSGGLIGGASLKSESFIKIIKIAEEYTNL
jgi:triosephosphate isomerase